MGKAQSKRSVDITTEAKKDDVIEEGTGKMGKIEDVDQLKPQVNGDTHHNETDVADKEKSVEAEGTENEKDLSTEKEQQPQIEPKTNLEGGDDAAATTPTADNKPVVENGNGNDDTLNESKNPAETSTTAATENGDDSSKKPKKEKVKKKWSLRSISFGKKDKQKPAKKEEGTTNGDCEKVPEEVAEEVTKSGEESAAVAANVEETTSTPAAEETSPAEEKADETKETVVVNGSSEPAKDEKPASEPTPEVIAVPVVAAAAAAAVVAEEKKIEKEEPAAVSNVTEEIIVKTDITLAAAEPNPTEILKSNETEEEPVTAKIEVKAESIQDDNAHKSSEEKEGITEIQQEIETEELKKIINDDGDSESAQNLPPPPLPCTSPPSQVSVFALSDSKDHEQDQQLSPPPPSSVDQVAQELPIAADQSAESVGSPVAEDFVAPPSAEIKGEAIVTDEKKMKTELEINLESTISSSTEPVPDIPEDVNSIPIIEECLSQKIQVVENTPTTPDEASSSKIDKILNEKLEGSEINSDQIAQTIALIDEVTQEAANISQNKLEEESSSAVKTEKIETTSDLSSNDPHPGDNKIPSTAPETISISETNIPSVLVDENEKQLIDTVESKSELLDVQAPSENIEQIAQVQTELIGDHVDLTQQVAVEPAAEISKGNVAEQPINIEQSKEILDIIVPQAAEEPSDKTETNLADDTKPTTETEEASQVAKSKENGIGENHAAETSATESLNGQVEHKTIEEIKSDCSEKLNNEPTTDIAVKVTE